MILRFYQQLHKCIKLQEEIAEDEEECYEEEDELSSKQMGVTKAESIADSCRDKHGTI